MKLTNILAVISIFFALSACSMEDDTVMNDVDKEIQNNTEAYASFDFSLKNDAITTKTSSYLPDEDPNDVESRVNNCYLAVFDADTKNLISSNFYDYTDLGTDNGNTSLNLHFSFKVSKDKKPNLKFVAIVNVNSVKDKGEAYKDICSLEDLQTKTTYGALMASQIVENPTVLVKVGEYDLTVDEYTTSSSLSQSHDSFCKTVIIPVSQRTSAVELSSLTVKAIQTDGTSKELQATNVSFNLYNINLHTKVNAGSDDVDNIAEVAYNDVELGSHLYTYENTTSEKTYIVVTYKVDGVQSQTKPLYIKTPVNGKDIEQVLANHLYKLDVTVTNGVANVFCTVKDWQKNTITGEWKETN